MLIRTQQFGYDEVSADPRPRSAKVSRVIQDGGGFLHPAPSGLRCRTLKRGGPRHPKVLEFSRLLKVSISHAVGILEMLWHHTAEFCPQGDIGRFTDRQIATAVGWQGDPSRLVGVLVGVALVDPCCTAHRLVIHGWVDHADTYTLKKLKRHNLEVIVSGHVRTVSGQFLPASASASALLPAPTPLPHGVSANSNGIWEKAGFPDSEDFEIWWSEIVRNHPNRNGNSQAKTAIADLVIKGRFVRSEFEAGYSKLAAAHNGPGPEHGRFAPNLLTLLPAGPSLGIWIPLREKTLAERIEEA